MSHTPDNFTPQQVQYLGGFAAGIEAARSLKGMPTVAAAVAGLASGASQQPVALTASALADPNRAAQDRALAAGKKLVNEEKAKRDKDPFALWDQMQANADEGRFPKGTDVFLYKFHGLFYVAPAQDSFMCRLRIPGGVMTADQLRGVADVAERFGGGFADATTRANLQIRQIKAADALNVLTALTDLGLMPRGSGADNIRNVTASPLAGIDPAELIDTLPLARRMHHYILNHRELYGLPRKFNIAFDGGGAISAVADTNDIGFVAVRVPEPHASPDIPAGVYFRMELGGITGHGDFARDAGLLLRPDQCVPLAAAVVRVFIEHGDRTDRRKARMKYVLDRLGLEGYMAEVARHYTAPLIRFPLDRCLRNPPADPRAHLGVHSQAQPGLHYVGVSLPVGRMTCDQMRALAAVAERHGSRTIRLTVWQNLILSDIPTDRIAAAQRDIQAAGLHWRASPIRAGLIACTGNGGCRFAASDTKGHALRLAEYLEPRLDLDQPINIHLTGCHHSCAQHYIGDIGLLATKVAVGEEMLEGYHVYLGGGHGNDRRIGRELFRDVTADRLPALIERMLLAYLAHRSPGLSFHDFAARVSIDDFRGWIEHVQNPAMTTGAVA
jgi:ferredoxin-nitrite reductase